MAASSAGAAAWASRGRRRGTGADRCRAASGARPAAGSERVSSSTGDREPDPGWTAPVGQPAALSLAFGLLHARRPDAPLGGAPRGRQGGSACTARGADHLRVVHGGVGTGEPAQRAEVRRHAQPSPELDREGTDVRALGHVQGGVEDDLPLPLRPAPRRPRPRSSGRPSRGAAASPRRLAAPFSWARSPSTCTAE